MTILLTLPMLCGPGTELVMSDDQLNRRDVPTRALVLVLKQDSGIRVNNFGVVSPRNYADCLILRPGRVRGIYVDPGRFTWPMIRRLVPPGCNGDL